MSGRAKPHQEKSSSRGSNDRSAEVVKGPAATTIDVGRPPAFHITTALRLIPYCGTSRSGLLLSLSTAFDTLYEASMRRRHGVQLPSVAKGGGTTPPQGCKFAC